MTASWRRDNPRCSSANGRFTRKSSAFAPVSSKVSQQSLLHSHMMVHYDKIRNAKPAIDNKPPKAMTSHVKAKDRWRKERERIHTRSHSTLASPARNMSMLNETMVALKSGQWHTLAHNGAEVQYAEQSNHTTPRDVAQTNNIGGLDDPEEWGQTYPTSFNNEHMLPASPRRPRPTPRGGASKLQTRSSSEEIEAGLNHLSLDDSIGANDDDSFVYSYKSDPSPVRSPSRMLPTVDLTHDPEFKQLKKQEQIRTEELKYLQFVEDITSDVIARNISSDRVLRRVFQFHLEKNMDSLDEMKMRTVISELMTDLQVADKESSDDERP